MFQPILPPRIACRVVLTNLLIVSLGFSFNQARSALADDVPPGQSTADLTEVVIQGVARPMRMSEFAGTAAVIDPKTIQDRATSNFQQLLEDVPGLSFAGGSARPRFFQIRGIGEFEQYEGAPNPSVGVLIDDFDFSGLGIASSLFDMRQVEVLQGPQSIRYGSSALAGIIALRSEDPTAVPEGQLQIGAGSDEYLLGAAAVGGAVPGTGDRIKLRVSHSHEAQDGFRNNAYLDRDDTNDRDEQTTRLKIRVQPDSDVQVDLTALHIENRNGYDAFAIDNSFTTQSDRPGIDELLADGISLRGEIRLAPKVALHAITSYLTADQNYSYDGDWGNNPFWAPYDPYDYYSRTDRDRSTLTQEFRLLSDDPHAVHGVDLQWVGGIAAMRLDEQSEIRDASDGTPYRMLDSDYRADTGAAFGQIEVPVQRGTSVTVGGRIEHRGSTYHDSNGVRLEPDDTMLGGEAALRNDLTDRLQWYALVSRGFKGGGVNPGTTVPDDRRLYDPEYLWNYELGLQGKGLDDRLSGSLHLFHARRSDAQLKLSIQNDPSDPLSFTYLTESSASARIVGLESSIAYDLTERWRWFTGGLLMDSKYTDVPEERADIQYRAQSHAPSWQYDLGTRYQLADHWFIRGDLAGKDRFYFDDSNNQRSDPYHLLALSLGYESNRWSWIIWGRNVLDERYAVRGFYFGDEPPDFPNKRYVQQGDPATIGTTVTVYF